MYNRRGNRILFRNNPRGEYVLVVEGAKEVEETEENEWENISIKEHVDKYIAEGLTSKDA